MATHEKIKFDTESDHFDSDSVFENQPCDGFLQELLKQLKSNHHSEKFYFESGARDLDAEKIAKGHHYRAITETLFAVIQAFPVSSSDGYISGRTLESLRELPKPPNLSLILKKE
ncbi:hypothetical protein M5U04_06825 [Xenorhabdus sp. XENO-1]|uniref:hypothetical protein n=1 Tax=Xenorhabdus bovienii TaxID=40576 RepID=UPI0020CA9C58|nr:hypothetical protein [Xenorhabdus bovienii]MCP9267820.1 hypothetical protein [Xenorhabdus bovienii subsp. africana]